MMAKLLGHLYKITNDNKTFDKINDKKTNRFNWKEGLI